MLTLYNSIPVGFDVYNLPCRIYVALGNSGNIVDNKNCCFVDNR